MKKNLSSKNEFQDVFVISLLMKTKTINRLNEPLLLNSEGFVRRIDLLLYYKYLFTKSKWHKIYALILNCRHAQSNFDSIYSKNLYNFHRLNLAIFSVIFDESKANDKKFENAPIFKLRIETASLNIVQSQWMKSLTDIQTVCFCWIAKMVNFSV